MEVHTADHHHSFTTLTTSPLIDSWSGKKPWDLVVGFEGHFFLTKKKTDLEKGYLLSPRCCLGNERGRVRERKKEKEGESPFF